MLVAAGTLRLEGTLVAFLYGSKRSILPRHLRGGFFLAEPPDIVHWGVALVDGKAFASPLAFIEGGTQNRSGGRGKSSVLTGTNLVLGF
jgi:hypothetical protein